jgi:hypothetical protein
MQFQKSRPWLKSVRRMISSPARGSRRAVLCVETMEARLSLSALPNVPAVQTMSAHFNPQPDPPTMPVQLSQQHSIIAIHPVQVQHSIIAIHPVQVQHSIIAIHPVQPRPVTDPNI